MRRIRQHSAVRCPRCGKKTNGKLYRARYTTANICEGCKPLIQDAGLAVVRVR